MLEPEPKILDALAGAWNLSLGSTALVAQCRNGNALLYYLGSVYFTAKILAATDQLELLCRQSNIRSRGMMQFE